jgi:glutaredoxin 3
MPEQSPEENKQAVTPSRRVNALPLFALILIAVFAINYKPSIEAIYCTAKTLSPKPDVIMLSTSWCPYCYEARRYFTNNEISYCEYDIEVDARGKNMYDDANKYADQTGMPLGTPVLFIGDHQLSGFDQNRVEKLLSEDKTL